MDNVAAPRSAFVTWLAWSQIVLAGLAVFYSLIQLAVMTVFLSMDQMRGVLQSLPPEFPSAYRWMVENMRGFTLGSLLLWVFVLWSSIALLQRRNWGRLANVWLCALGIAGNIAGVIWALQIHVYILVATVVLAAVTSVLFAWLAWKLCTPRIAAEFHS